MIKSYLLCSRTSSYSHWFIILLQRLLLLNQWTSSQSEYRLDSPDPDADRIVLTKQSKTPNSESNLQESSLAERLDHVERRLNQLGVLDSELQRRATMASEKVALVERRCQMVNELQVGFIARTPSN